MVEEQPKGFWKYFTPAAVGFKWGGGVVSNTTFASVTAFIAMGVVGWSLSGHPNLAFAGCCLIALLLMFYLGGTWLFSSRYPTLAALGGPEYVRIKEAEMGTKAHPHMADTQNVEAPVLIEQGASRHGA